MISKVFAPILQAPESRAVLDFIREVEGDLTRLARSKRGFLSQLTEYVLDGSGKRVRPALVFISSQFGPSAREDVKRVAQAVELIHIATLVHDDLVDDATLRRQKPTVGVKFGDASAVLLGDYVYAQAFQSLAALDDPALMSLFAETTMAMCDGEIGQLERRYFFDLTESEYLGFLDKKTAALMAASCRAGGKLCGLAPSQIEALDAFGRRLGVAFQIVDDILDLEGEENLTGKTLRTDLTHGKMTLPLILYVSRLKSDADRSALFDLLKNPNGHTADLIARLREAGAIEESRAKAAALLRQAEEALALLPDAPPRRLLSDVSRQLSNRNA